MNQDQAPRGTGKDRLSSARFATLTASGPHPPAAGPLNTPVVRASTIVYDSVEAYMQRHDGFYDDVIYGLYGTQTTYALAEAVTALEGGYGTVVTSSGTAAIAIGFASFLRAGDHALVSDSVYRSTRKFCDHTLNRLGVEVTYFDPLATRVLDSLFKPNTRAVYLESPGSLTFEMTDVHRVTQLSRQRGAVTLLDNTWATPVLFRPLEHGVDVSIESATKYLSGHSDVMLGTLTAGTREVFERLKETAASWGNCAGPDECYLVHRGLRTLDVRLERHARNAAHLVEWLLQQREVRRVLYPALESDPGYALWKRDYRGASGLFGVVLDSGDEKRTLSLFDDLKLFKMGSSWGGYESLMVPAWPPPVRTCRPAPQDGYLIRIHAGLEDSDDLIEDLAGAFARLRDR
ncbi:MAG: cystathionine beta-lyase [Steroidobacteraceae bacterium]